MEKNHEEGAAEIDLFQLLLALRKKIVVLLAAVIAGGLIAGIYTHFFITPVYSSTSMMLVLGNESSDSSLTDLQIGSQLTGDYSVLIKSRPILQQVIDNLGLNMSYQQLEGLISIQTPENARILEVTVTYTDPQMAKQIVDELSTVSVSYIGEQMEMAAPKIIEEGDLPAGPVSPSLKKNMLLGAVAGGVIAAGIVILITILNDTIKSEEEITRYLGIPTLGSVPLRESSDPNRTSMHRKKKKKKRRRGK